VRLRIQDQKTEFISKNYKPDRDVRYDYQLVEKIPHQKQMSVVFNDDCGKKGAPWYANYRLMVFLDILVLGWIQRIVLNSKAKVVEYKLVKYIT